MAELPHLSTPFHTFSTPCNHARPHSTTTPSYRGVGCGVGVEAGAVNAPFHTTPFPHLEDFGMTHKIRPRRQRKGDRLTSPDENATAVRVDYAVAPFDRHARKMDEKWGVDRLPELVSPETAERYGSAIAKLNEAIDAGDPELAVRKAGVCIRGLDAMDAEATAAGHQPITDWWEYDLDGFRFAIVRDTGDWKVVQRERPDLKVIYSMREVAVMLRDMKSLHAVKEEFPGATVERVSPKPLPSSFYDAGGDELPF